MAREDSVQTLQASQEFDGFLNTLPLQDAWVEYTWKSNSFKARKARGRILIKYAEYRTENAFGTYTFNRKGKLVYYLTSRESV